MLLSHAAPANVKTQYHQHSLIPSEPLPLQYKLNNMDNASRRNFSSGAKWEPIVGYSRAVRIGQVIEVAGTCSVDQEGNPVGAGDAYQQTKRILEIIHDAITHLGGRMEDIVRTRIFTTDIALWTEIGKAHGEVFHSINPVTTMVEVSNLISADYLVEIEATAIVTTM